MNPAMSQAASEISPAMARAIDLLRAGKSVEAEEVLVKATRETEDRLGPHHPDTASIYNELGTILINVQNPKSAVAAYRKACAGPMPSDKAAAKDRLSYLMNLGMALQEAKQLDEAENVLREGCEARRVFYGAEHAGHAFGIEPLAALLMARGKHAAALDLLETTVAIFWNSGHPRVATALVLRAEALKGAGRTDPPFDGTDQLPDDIIAEMAKFLSQRTREADPGILSQVFQDFIAMLRARYGPDHALVTESLIQVANLESSREQEGDFEARIRVAREVLDTYDRQGKAEEAVQTLQGLGLALAEAGRPDEAVDTYREAMTRAKRISAPVLTSQIRRNFGLLLADLHRDHEAETELAGAVEDARRSSDETMLGRAQIALAIFYQHRDRLEAARPLLEAALKTMNPAEPDAITARSHLQAVLTGQPCGCGNQGAAMADAFREFVRDRLPQDLLEKFEVRLQDGDFKVQVQLKRKPSNEEVEHMNRVINHALAEFRKKMRERK